jgi:hypothetical protein
MLPVVMCIDVHPLSIKSRTIVKEGMIEDLQQELQSIIHWPML